MDPLLNVTVDSELDLDILDTFFKNESEATTVPNLYGESKSVSGAIQGSSTFLGSATLQDSKTSPSICRPSFAPLPGQLPLLMRKCPASVPTPDTKKSPFASPFLFPPNPALPTGSAMSLGMADGVYPTSSMLKGGQNLNNKIKLPMPAVFPSAGAGPCIPPTSVKRILPLPAALSPQNAHVKIEPASKGVSFDMPPVGAITITPPGNGNILVPAISTKSSSAFDPVKMEPIQFTTAVAGKSVAQAQTRWLCPQQTLPILTAGKRGHAAISPASSAVEEENVATNGERGSSVILSREDKKKRRLIRNRKSAQLHRERKKAFIDSLKLQVQQLSAQNTQLKGMLAQVVAANQQLRRQHTLVQANQQQRRRPVCPHCGDFQNILDDESHLFDSMDPATTSSTTSTGRKGSIPAICADFSSDSSALDTASPSPPGSPGASGRGTMLLFALVFSFVFFGGNNSFSSWGDVDSVPPGPLEIGSSTDSTLSVYGAGQMVFTPATASAGPDQSIRLEGTRSGVGTGRVLLMAAEESEDVIAISKTVDDSHAVKGDVLAHAPVTDGDRNKALALWQDDRISASSGNTILTSMFESDVEDSDSDVLTAAAVALLQQRGYRFQSTSGEDVIPLLPPMKAALDLDEVNAEDLLQAQRTEAIAVYLAKQRQSSRGNQGPDSGAAGSTLGTNHSLVMCPQAHGLLSESFLQRTARAQGLPDGWWWHGSDSSGAGASGTASTDADSEGNGALQQNASLWELAPSPRLRLGARKASARLAGPVNSHSEAADLLLLVPADSLHWGGWGNTRSQDSSSGLFEIGCRLETVRAVDAPIGD